MGPSCEIVSAVVTKKRGKKRSVKNCGCRDTPEIVESIFSKHPVPITGGKCCSKASDDVDLSLDRRLGERRFIFAQYFVTRQRRRLSRRPGFIFKCLTEYNEGTRFTLVRRVASLSRLKARTPTLLAKRSVNCAQVPSRASAIHLKDEWGKKGESEGGDRFVSDYFYSRIELCRRFRYIRGILD